MTAGALHHIAVAVPSIEGALPFYRETLGLRPGRIRELPDQGVRIAFLAAGAVQVELVEPLDDASGVARFLAARGRATLHHVCFAVDDLSGTLDRLAELGLSLIDRSPRPGADGEVAFLHPDTADGVLVELIDRATIAATVDPGLDPPVKPAAKQGPPA
jgi:methylmalonyl-CoA/ethylmalonyl-CoA epimerase